MTRKRGKRPPQADHVRSRIIEFISSQVGDKDSLADVKTVGLWESVRPEHLVDRIEAGARSGVLGYWYSRLSYHRPDLVPLYVAAVRRAGFVLPAAPEPIQWLRPALNAFLLSPEELAVIPTFYERSSLRSFLDDIELPPPEPRRVASMLADGSWDRITAEELKPSLAWALRNGQEALEWLVGGLRFYRMDLMPALRTAANELDRDRRPKIIDEEREMALVDDEWAQLAPKLTARALGKLLKTAATKGVLPTAIERIQKHRPDLVSVVASWRERMRKNE